VKVAPAAGRIIGQSGDKLGDTQPHVLVEWGPGSCGAAGGALSVTRGGSRRLDKPIIRNAASAVAATFAGVIAVVCWIMWTQPRSVDFVSFWAAGRMVLEGAGAAIYDVDAHGAVEETAVNVGLMPFPYPPPFALIVAPFGALPYGTAFTVWVLVTGAIYLFASRPWMSWRVALAQPSLLVNGFVGQIAFLTTALFMAGTRMLGSRPMAGGALLGLLAIKPQLGVLLPVALVAGGHWRAFAGAALSGAALLIVGLMVLGLESYTAFLDLLSTFAGFVTASRWPWHKLASVYALLRYFTVAPALALAVHGAVAVGATVLVWRAWKGDWDGKVAILAAATLLIPPYLLSYDGLLLAVPVAWLLTEGKRPDLAVAVWVLSLLPIASLFGWIDAPNILPLAALLSLVAIAAVPRVTGGAAPAPA